MSMSTPSLGLSALAQLKGDRDREVQGGGEGGERGAEGEGEAETGDGAGGSSSSPRSGAGSEDWQLVAPGEGVQEEEGEAVAQKQ